MSKAGVFPKSFGFQEPSIPKLISAKESEKLYKHFASAGAQSPAQGASPPKPAVTIGCGPAVDAILSQVLSAKQSAVKAALIAAYVARNYLEAHVSTCRVPDCDPKPIVLDKPDCHLPVVLSEKKFTGDELARQLEAGGAAVVGRNGAYGVSSGRCGDLESEIDPGESLTFHVPNGGRASGGTVTIDKLFSDGPDRHRQEQGILEVYDGDLLVKTIDLRGYSATNGQQTLDVDVGFTKLVFKAKGEFKGGGNHSDFALRDVTIRQSTDAPPIQAQPQPYPSEPYIGIPRFAGPQPQPYPSEPYIGIPRFAEPQPQPYPSEPYIGIPKFGWDVVAPPAPPKDPFVPVTARTLARLAQRIDRSRLPENVQNLLLDRIATLLADLKHAPRDGDHRPTTVLVGIASLIQTLDSAVPAHVSRKVGDGAKEHVMDHLRSMLFAAATGRGDQLDYASQVA